jgi:hypothetical protein
MSTAQFTCPLIVVIPGQLISASLWNGEFQNLFTNINPLGVGAYSDTDPQMQTQTDPFPSGSTSRPTSLGGELERIRFVLAEITGNTYWYQVPTNTLATIASILARFPVQTVDIGNLQVTTAKLALLAVTAAQIANNTITATQIVNATITETQLATSVAGNGLTGGAGTPLAVNVDNSTLDISGDAVEVKALGITGAQIAAATISSAKLDSSVPVAVGLKSIQMLSFAVSFGATGTQVTTNTTISSVNTAKAVVVLKTLSVSSSGATTHQTPMVTLSLTSATNLQTILNVFSNMGGSGDSFNIVVVVLEFN